LISKIANLLPFSGIGTSVRNMRENWGRSWWLTKPVSRAKLKIEWKQKRNLWLWIDRAVWFALRDLEAEEKPQQFELLWNIGLLNGPAFIRVVDDRIANIRDSMVRSNDYSSSS
jgi:hypothetical protein